MSIYKPQTRKGPVFLDPVNHGPPTIKLSDGRVITAVPANQRGGSFYNEGNYQWVFDNDVLGQKGAVLTYGGKTQTLDDTNMSYRGDVLGSLTQSTNGAIGDMSQGFANPNMINFDPIGYKPIGYKPITKAPYDFVDPIEAAKRYNTFNREQEGIAYDTSKRRGVELTDLDTNYTEGFARRMSGLQESLIASENKFNQAQRLAAVDFAMPDLRSSLDAKRSRAETYASGRLLSSAEDRAYQVAAQSASADGSFVRGFGDDSVFGRRTSDVLSAQQRLGISQMGEGLLNDWISQGSSILIDTPLKSSISQRLPSTPQILPSQQAAQQQNALTNLTTVPLQFGISSEINQEQFDTNLEQGTRQFNASNTFAKNQFNAANTLAKDQFNATGQFQESQARFGGFLAQQQIATAAQNRAQDIQRQDAHDEAASRAADQNTRAQQDAGNVGAIAQVGGAIAGFFGLSGKLASPAPGGQTLNAVAGSPPITTFGGGPAPVIQTGSGQAPAVQSGAAPSIQAPAESAPPTTISGAQATYRGASIPVQSSALDSGLTAGDVSSGFKAMGSMVSNIGQAGPATPQMSSLGRGLGQAATSAQEITDTFQYASTPEARMQLASQLHNAASNNAPSEESKATVDQIFSQVREHLDTGVGVNGQAAGIAGFIQNYNDYNGPEKARAITNISFTGQDLEAQYGIKDLTSKSLARVPVPGTNGKMTLEDAMSLTSSGYNVSSLVDNWDDINEIHSAINGPSDSLLSVANTGRSLGLLSDETPESVTNRQMMLKKAGAQPAGAWGVGAFMVPDSSNMKLADNGLTLIGKTGDGQDIVIPTVQLASTGRSSGVIGSGTDIASQDAPSMAPTTLAIGQGTVNVYNSWPTDYIPKQQGRMGSSPPVTAGLYKKGQQDPNMMGNIIMGAARGFAIGYAIHSALAPAAVATPSVIGVGAVGAAGAGAAAAGTAAIGGAATVATPSVISMGVVPLAPAAPGLAAVAAPIAIGVGAVIAGKYIADKYFSSGKSGAQGDRDELRVGAQNLGLADEDFNVTLASGEKFNIGVDGHGGQREWHDSSQRRPDHAKVENLNAWDVDYTKDLDGVMQVAGNALSALMYGSNDADSIKQMGNTYTNAAVSDAGTADLTKEGYGKSQANMQGFFKKAGIETKAEAYALSNQMLHEGRISQTQAVQIQQGINLTFDENGFQAANQLLEGVKIGRRGEDLKNPVKEENKPRVAPTVSKPDTIDDTPRNISGGGATLSPNINVPKIPGVKNVSSTSLQNFTSPMSIQSV